MRLLMLTTDVMFSSFGDHCNFKNVMIMTNPGSADFMHPIQTQDIHMDNVQHDCKFLIHRPDPRLVYNDKITIIITHLP